VQIAAAPPPGQPELWPRWRIRPQPPSSPSAPIIARNLAARQRPGGASGYSLAKPRPSASRSGPTRNGSEPVSPLSLFAGVVGLRDGLVMQLHRLLGAKRDHGACLAPIVAARDLVHPGAHTSTIVPTRPRTSPLSGRSEVTAITEGVGSGLIELSFRHCTRSRPRASGQFSAPAENQNQRRPATINTCCPHVARPFSGYPRTATIAPHRSTATFIAISCQFPASFLAGQKLELVVAINTKRAHASTRNVHSRLSTILPFDPHGSRVRTPPPWRKNPSAPRMAHPPESMGCPLPGGIPPSTRTASALSSTKLPPPSSSRPWQPRG